MSEGPADFDAVAEVAQRLAVLLDAGLAPVSAWRYLAAASSSAGVTRLLDCVVEQGEVGRELAIGLLAARQLAPAEERPAWSALAAAWWVATESGAPLAPTLHRFAHTLRDLAHSLREIDVALSGPRATSRIVLTLPAAGLLMGLLLGFDAPRILLTTPPGWVCLTVGSLLVGVGLRWNRGLLRRARSLSPTPGLALELLAIAVSGGLSLDRARALVDDALGEADLGSLGVDADGALDFARSAGVPVAGLLHAEATEARRRSRAEGQRAAIALGTRLLVPLGVCILPAFVTLGVAPIVLAIITSTAAAL